MSVGKLIIIRGNSGSGDATVARELRYSGYMQQATSPYALEQVIGALRQSWSYETTFDHPGWSEQNPARGHCIVSSLIMQDYFGGDLRRYQVAGRGIAERHYVNVLDGGVVVDTTASQYQIPITLTVLPFELDGFSSIREKRLSDDETRGRYELLSERVAHILGSSKV